MDIGNNISPIDGRYAEIVKSLTKFFSEKTLMKWRIHVENEYLEMIVKTIRLKTGTKFAIIEPDPDFFEKIKQIEQITKHDVKAVEYYLRDLYREKYPECLPLIHIGLTSEDVNALCRSLILKKATKFIFYRIAMLTETIDKFAQEWMAIPMLARTHGQTATPTTLGKELKVYTERLKNQTKIYSRLHYRTKFGGATGGFNALNFAYPSIDWKNKLDAFVEDFELERHIFTTQIDHNDNHAEIFDLLKRINTILLDFCQDIWLYLMLDYFSLATNPNEIGSSTMPHKVNPINFENAEGNLKLANCLLNFFAEKLPVSRLQRDLTDSTVSRNIGVAYSHIYLALNNLLEGIVKLTPNREKIAEELDANWAILGEAVQTVLRKNGVENAYEQVKDLIQSFHSEKFGKKEYLTLVEKLDIKDAEDKQRLLALTPASYANYSIATEKDGEDKDDEDEDKDDEDDEE